MDRSRQAKWDADHLCSATTKLTKEEYQTLRCLLACKGLTVYRFLHEYAARWLRENVEFRD